MSIARLSKYDLALHDVPICAVCNKPVEHFESMYDINTSAKRFRAYCHGQMEECFLNDEAIENSGSVRFGQAFIDKLPQPQLENK